MADAGLGEMVYRLEPDLPVEEFVDVLRRSTLAERRPVDDRLVMEDMLRNADLVLTARAGGRLAGVARALTDYARCTYLADLAVDAAFQRRGIGKELLRRVHEAAGRGTTLILLAAPKAREYYPHVGLQRHDSCWTMPREIGEADGSAF
ncbi:GNAT family N-acetyltransferase [Alienimonas sp. DA493]|uniref:GNAT family N-acetyltransferase n=1 Tax=Alienimonas sp. DA493 TaxID=3373605 RepID=UPI003754E297